MEKETEMKNSESTKKVKRFLSEQTKRELVAQFAASSLSQGAFCREKGIALSTFTTWVKMYHPEEQSKQKAFIPIIDTHKEQCRLEFELPGGISIRVYS